MAYTVERDWNTRSGLRAVAIESYRGHRCGYVAVGPTHPLHGKPYDRPCDCLTEMRTKMLGAPMPENAPLMLMLSVLIGEIESRPDIVLSVHGGVTYSSEEPGSKYPAPSADLWWFGFDCNHLHDQDDPKDLEYVVGECERLAEQLASLSKPQEHAQ